MKTSAKKFMGYMQEYPENQTLNKRKPNYGENTMKKIVAFVIVFILAASCAGCAGSSNSSGSYNYGMEMAASSAAPQAAAAGEVGFTAKREMAMDTDMMAEAEEMPEAELADDYSGPTVQSAADTNRKIIKNMDLNLQTLMFDQGVTDINNLVNQYGGYIQDSYVQGTDMYTERGTRYASFTARIPVEKLDAFANVLGETFNLTSKSQNSQDITESYFDSKARLNSLKVQEERLLAMLENATELEYMLQIEQNLANVRYEIESLTSSLNRMDNYVNYSTVTIYLQEVVKYEPVENVPVTFSQRISRASADSWKAFGEFWQGLAVFIVAAFPFLVVLAVILAVVIILVRRGNKKNAARRAAGQAQYRHPYQPQYAPQEPSNPTPQAPAPETERDGDK